MRRFPSIQIARIALLRDRALLRCFGRRTQDSQRRLSIAGVASISILLSGVLCAGAATGEDLVETGLVKPPVPEVPMVDANTLHENPGGIDLSTPQGFDDDCPMNYEMPHLEHPDQYSSADSFPSDQSGYADEYSPMATSEILMPMTSAPVMLLPKTFVHARKTVRTSERMAEIWVTLPKDSQSSVSVNFVEHPPEGDFRIFRTSINTHEPRRFYLSAKRWDVHANRWIDLEAVPTLSSDETQGLGYVDLFAGQRTVVQFDNPQPPSVTSAFLFEPEEQEIVGMATFNDGHITSINSWPVHSETLNISLVPSPQRLSVLPSRPFTARIIFTIQDGAAKTLATLKPLRVIFDDSAHGVEGEINFNEALAVKLSDALVKTAARRGTYRLKAKLQFTRDLGDAGHVNVSGDLGNDIELTINP